MRAAKLVAPCRIEVQEVPRHTAPGPEEVSIQVKAVGICGTDVHIFQGHRDDVVLPRVMGHELSGVVVSTGHGVSRLQEGDRVVLDPVFSCGACAVCASGHENVCSQVQCFGVQMDGGFQDFIQVPAHRVHKLPERISFEEGALAEPYSVAANIFSRVSAAPEDRLVIIGAGTIGLALLQAARGLGCQVLMADIVDSKLQKALEFGAAQTVNTAREDLHACVDAFAPGGADIVVDAVGIHQFFELSADLAAPVGRIAVIGFDGADAHIPPVKITKKELTIVGSRMNCHKFPTVMQWLAEGRLDPGKMITGVYPVEQIQAAFEHTIADNEHCVKTIITF